MTEREVDPRTVASGLVTGLANHQIFVPGTNRRNRLFVMLPGTDAPPRIYRLIARTGAQEGYHAIGLAYPNEDAIASVCGNSSRPDCSGEVRNEILTGQDTSPLVSVNRVNSIIGRLIELIAFLDRSFPSEGWGQYLVSGQPDWSRIAIAGHSQGAGLAGFLGKEVRLLRIGMFSGPNDPGPAAGQAALWTARPNITPAGDQFGFTHTADPLAPIAVSSGNWVGIGLGAFGGQVSVDGRSPPFDGSRQLVTSAPPNPNPTGPTASPQHGAPAVDSVTPIAADGQPLFRPVWVHMLFAP
ncbi:MAG: hypothetical protein NBV68_18610 [Erythrobacter sp.]|uniref:BPSS1187 family protein n=1 Tax=Erythrobacter sp. TaxID=1042 RepID=UPI0025DF049D|nr:hypothetical protein [Erythrobacter sp.]MCM0001389.1 hypothetical protein [Erythrobacter sp.]